MAILMEYGLLTSRVRQILRDQRFPAEISAYGLYFVKKNDLISLKSLTLNKNVVSFTAFYDMATHL